MHLYQVVFEVDTEELPTQKTVEAESAAHAAFAVGVDAMASGTVEASGVRLLNVSTIR
jgi:hypothetical protein